MAQSRSLFVYFRPFLFTISTIQIEKSEDCVLGIRTRGRRMVSADESMELWWQSKLGIVYSTYLELGHFKELCARQTLYQMQVSLSICQSFY